MIWALLTDSTVTEITNIDPHGRFHPSLIWVECSPEVQVGWVVSNELLQPPVVQVDAAYAFKLREINQACEAAITGGFWSSALGGKYQYSSALDDQLNLTGAILGGSDMPYASKDEQGVKAFRAHTAAQLRQVGDDFTLAKLQLLQKANERKQQLDKALADNDQAALEAVTWEDLPS